MRPNIKPWILFIPIMLTIMYSCGSYKHKSITEPLNNNELQDLNIDEAKYYEWILQWMKDVPTSVKVDWVDVSYGDMFDLLISIKKHKNKWEQEGNKEWAEKYADVFTAVNEYYEKWVQWEEDNRLEKKVTLELKRVKKNDRALKTDILITSHIGEINGIEGDFWFGEESPSITKHFLYTPSKYCDIPFRSLLIEDFSSYGYTPDDLTQKPLNEIDFGYHLRFVKLPTGNIHENSHHKEIPSIIKRVWNDMKANKCNFDQLNNYTYYVNEIASELNLDYMPSSIYLENYFSNKGEKVNAKANKVYQYIRHFYR